MVTESLHRPVVDRDGQIDLQWGEAQCVCGWTWYRVGDQTGPDRLSDIASVARCARQNTLDGDTWEIKELLHHLVLLAQHADTRGRYG